MREVRLVETLGRYTSEEVRSTLAMLESSGQARSRTYRGQVFWGLAGAAFGDSPRKGT